MAKRIATTWQLTTYEVWGNAKDGYEINNAFRADEIELRLSIQTRNAGTANEFKSASPTIAQLRKVMGIDRIHLEIDQNYSDDTRVHLVRKSDGYPICELHCVSHDSLSPIRAKA